MANKKQFGLPLAISMIVGIVIGSGIFFKSDEVLSSLNGNFKLGILAWICGGIAMVFGALTISVYASKVSVSNGIIDYFEYAFSNISKKSGEFAGYITAWFMSVLYFPALIAVLAWVSASYTTLLLGIEDTSNSMQTWVIALIYMAILFAICIFSRVISSYLQISATILKLIPLFVVAIAGVFLGIKNGVTVEDLNMAVPVTTKGFTAAVIATAFAFDGWILATTMNDEIKDSKKNLPKALFFGTVLILFIYIAYFSGIVLTVGSDAVVSNGDAAVNIAVTSLFGKSAGTIVIVFVVISCLGTLNGLIMTGSRTFYQIAKRGHGIFPKKLSVINEQTNSPVNSTIVSIITSLIMFAIWYNNFNGVVNIKEFLGTDFLDVTSLPIVLNYIFLSILYIAAMLLFKEEGIIKRFIFPILALLGALVIIYGGAISDTIRVFLIISIIVIAIGALFFKRKSATN